MVSKGRPARGRLYNLWSPQRQTDTKGSHAAQSRAQHSHRSAALNRGRWHRGIPHISVDLPSHLRRRRGIHTACRLPLFGTAGVHQPAWLLGQRGLLYDPGYFLIPSAVRALQNGSSAQSLTPKSLGCLKKIVLPTLFYCTACLPRCTSIPCPKSRYMRLAGLRWASSLSESTPPPFCSESL